VRELGREIARRGWILLTGGSLLDRSLVICEGQVKEAAMLGAASVENEGIARLIGILPERQAQGQEPKEPTWDRPSRLRSR
jgi:hypothetical protein